MSALAQHLRFVARLWRPNLAWLPLLLLLTLISTGVTLGYPLVFGHVLEEVRRVGEAALPREQVQAHVLTLVWIMLAVGAARFVAGFYPAVRALLNHTIEIQLRRRLFGEVLGKPSRFFVRFRTGDVLTRLTDDISGYPKIAWFACSGVFRALDSSSRVVCCLAVMFWLDAGLALWSLLPVPLMIGSFLLLRGKLQAASEAQRAEASATSDFLEAAFSGVQVVQAANAQPRLTTQLGAQLERRAGAEVRLARLWVLFSIFFQAQNVAGQLVVVLIGGLRVLDGSLGLGDFFAFYLYMGMLLAPMMDLPNLLVTGRQAFVNVDRLEELSRAEAGRPASVCQGSLPLPPLTAIEAEGLTFGYQAAQTGDAAGPPLLEGVELRVARGEQVAVVGEIGTGKTTLLRLLSGGLEPEGGEVRWNGRPLREYAGAGFRAALGYVPQDPVLFATTIRENVLLGREEQPERLARAIRLAGLEAELAALPDGLDHRLGLRGRGLSGGQRQRLTIARALYGDPQLLVLDDITAALDAENEERFWERVLETWPDTTVLVVTHRAATAERMQRQVRLGA